MRLILVLLTGLILLPTMDSHARSEETYGDIENVVYVRNYDGDTITFNIPGVHPLIGDKISIRVDGIDTPEIKGKCDQEKLLAKRAKIIVHDLMTSAKTIILKDVGRGKYFRITATVLADGKDLGDVLVEAGLAVRYDGGTKVRNWCLD